MTIGDFNALMSNGNGVSFFLGDGEVVTNAIMVSAHITSGDYGGTMYVEATFRCADYYFSPPVLARHSSASQSCHISINGVNIPVYNAHIDAFAYDNYDRTVEFKVAMSLSDLDAIKMNATVEPEPEPEIEYERIESRWEILDL